MSSANPGSAADIGIPAPAQIVRSANFIAVGTLENRETDTLFHATRVLKRDLSTPLPPLPLKLLNPNPAFGFELPELAHRLGSDPTLILGDLEKQGTSVSLRWMHASVWPHGFQPLEFPSSSLPECVGFVTAVLEYEALAGTAGKIVSKLLHDADGPRRYAVLGVLEAVAQQLDGSVHAELGRHLTWAVFAKVLAGARGDRHVNENLLSLFPLLPPSVAIPYFLETAGASDTPLSSPFRSHVEALLRINGVIAGPGRSSVTDLLAAFDQARARFRTDDAGIALRMFESSVPEIQASADKVLELILDKTLSAQEMKLGLSKRKRLWQRQIKRQAP
jgi:hypothetical protein